MKRLIVSEFQRIINSRRNWGLLAFYMLVIIVNCAFRFVIPAGTYDGKNYNVVLNSLNFSPFAFYEMRLALFYIILPVLFIGSINYEQATGAFRMHMIRPYRKHQFIISKLIVLAITTFILIITAFLVSTIFGYLFMSKVHSVKFYNSSYEFSAVQAFVYTLRLFTIQFIISLSILALSSVIGTIINNSVISIFAVMAVLAGLGFYTKLFEFLNNTTKYGFYVLSGTAPLSFYISLVGLIIGGILVSTLLWEKKDYRL